MIFGISGKARAGKDTLFSFAVKDGFVRRAFADELKGRVRRDFGLTLDHTDGALKETPLPELNGFSPRQLLIDYGTTLFRKYKGDYWVDFLINDLKGSTANVMVTDVRFPNEADAIKAIGGKIIRLERYPERDSMVAEATKLSISETALDSYTGFDYVLKGEENRVPRDLENFWEAILSAQSIGC